MHADAFAETCTCRQHQLKIAFQPAGCGRANHVIALAERQGGKDGFMEKQETGNTGSNRNTPEPGRQFTVTQGYLKDHIYMGVQKRSCSRILKKDFLNVELYLWIELETDHPEEGVLAFKMPAWFPGACRLPEEALWAAARENMRGSFTVKTLASVIGFPEEDESGKLHIMTSSRCVTGAAALAFPEEMERYCTRLGEEGCYILPSSKQELILVPASYPEEGAPEALAQLVASVNRTHVPEASRLPACAYYYGRGTGRIVVAASCEEDG